MKLIVDTNIILAALIVDSTCRKIMTHANADFFYIPFSEKEISKYESMVLRKAKITSQEFHLLLEKLKTYLIELDDRIILSRMAEAGIIMDSIDPDDTHFIAAALAIGADIWSDDNHFGKQHKVNIWKTKDLVKFLEE